ncbi:MAG: hypothetical protein M1822_001215 [Bathelium mastoideum]|nr:MAG: hypothetical protein M1822_001215 [Bathelium mastoideum]
MADVAPTITDLAASWLRPAHLLALGVYYFLWSILDTIFVERSPLALVDIQKLRNKSFSRLWLDYGLFAPGALISWEIADKLADVGLGADLPEPIPSLLQSVSGMVLDIGPGSGTQVHNFKNCKDTTVYGAEPEIALHGTLHRNIEKDGLGGKYHILTCGAEKESLVPACAKEGLLQQGIGSGVFDYIVCLRVLCGVTNAQDTVDGLYRLLKPGGVLIIGEHVKNPWPHRGGWFIPRALQKVYMLLGWSFYIGGCTLDRDTEQILLRAPGSSEAWEKVDLDTQNAWGSMPRLLGYLVKKR